VLREVKTGVNRPSIRNNSHLRPVALRIST
jgi:hypothetical protein